MIGGLFLWCYFTSYKRNSNHDKAFSKGKEQVMIFSESNTFALMTRINRFLSSYLVVVDIKYVHSPKTETSEEEYSALIIYR
jgi:hypothetical protein